MKTKGLELSGSDYFLCAMDRITRRSGSCPNSPCRLVVEVEGKIDPDVFRRRINDSPFLQWMANVKKAASVPFSIPRWRSNGSGKGVPVVCEDGLWPNTAEERISSFSPKNLSNGGQHPFSFILSGHDGDRSCCILNWDHTLMDAHGAEILLHQVFGRRESEPEIESLLPAEGQEMGTRIPSSLGFAGRLSYARKSIRYISEASVMPIAVLQTSDSRGDHADQYYTICFNDEETEQVVSHCATMGVSYSHSLFYLAATARALHAVRSRRSAEEVPYLVPVPLNLRRKGGIGPAFSNNVSFLFYRILPEEIRDFRKTVLSLKDQMREQVMQEIPHSCAEMMRMMRRLPLPLYSRLLSGPTRGQLASFFFSYTGDCCPGMEKFLNLPIRQVIHLAPATSIPGLSVVFMRHRNCLKTILSFRDSLIDQEDLRVFEEQLRTDLLPGTV